MNPTATARETRTSMCPLDCPDTCSIEVTLEEGRVVQLDGDRRNPITDGFLCGKVRRFPEHVYHELRVTHPLIRSGEKGSGEFRRASWDEALELVVERIRAVRERSGGEAILPLMYGGSNGNLTHGANDAAFFTRLGASRLLTTVCAAPTGAANMGLYGKMPGVAYEDFEAAKLIVVWGMNPEASGIHQVPILKRAQANGTKLVVVDPRRTKLAKGADLHLAPRPGTDLPLALSVLRELFESGAADEAFLAEHTHGADELRVRAAAWSFERAAAVSGVPAADLAAFTRLYAESSPALVRCGWGLERNRNGGSAVCAVLALPAVAGKFGVRGGGYILSNRGLWRVADLADADAPRMRPVNMNQVGRALCGELGLDPCIELLFVYDANPLATLPDQERVRLGLARENLFTVVHEQVLTDTTRWADVVLPATTFLEHTELRVGYGTYAMALAEPVIEPVGEARPNYALFAELIERLGLQREGDTADPKELARRALRDEPEAWKALERDGVALHPDPRPVQFVSVFPRTPDGKVHLVQADLEREAPGGLYHYAEDPGDESHPLALISPSTTRTISSSLGELFEGLVPVSLHPDDAAARGLTDGDAVRVHNRLGEVRTRLVVDPDLRPGVALLPKGMWASQTQNGNTANTLAPDTLTDLAGGACFNDARVEVERA